jgi:hypothetical protein
MPPALLSGSSMIVVVFPEAQRIPANLMFRLLFGRTVDTLTLARNARTSPEMIDRFYAAPLQGEMNVGELQSKRRPRPWE